MFVSHEDEISKKELSAETLRGVSKQILVGPQEGWQDYVMRQMHLEIEGYTPHHRHRRTRHCSGRNNRIPGTQGLGRLCSGRNRTSISGGSGGGTFLSLHRSERG